MMKILFTVCGRAGSTGCKNKNIRPMCGFPLVYYALSLIGLYKQAHPKYRIHAVLSTDSEVLMDLVRRQSVEIMILKRNAELAKGEVPKIAVIKDALLYAERQTDSMYDLVVDLDLTSPLRTLADVEKAVETSKQNLQYEIVFSAVESRRSPFYHLVKESNGFATVFMDDSFYTERQQIPPTFDMNGSIYVYRTAFLHENKTNRFFDAKCGMIIMVDTGILDIDTEKDFEMMDIIARYMFEKYPDYANIQKHIAAILSSKNGQ